MRNKKSPSGELEKLEERIDRIESFFSRKADEVEKEKIAFEERKKKYIHPLDSLIKPRFEDWAL